MHRAPEYLRSFLSALPDPDLLLSLLGHPTVLVLVWIPPRHFHIDSECSRPTEGVSNPLCRLKHAKVSSVTRRVHPLGNPRPFWQLVDTFPIPLSLRIKDCILVLRKHLLLPWHLRLPSLEPLRRAHPSPLYLVERVCIAPGCRIQDGPRSAVWCDTGGVGHCVRRIVRLGY